uniref:Biotin carboxyl carrier protein of acetyl-CoA carboxylase n=1 Tax=Rhodymenia pseudopalmata TaxID=31502 RepID=A0A1C9C7C1_RHOPU|nr:acetyl-CoA carboxylase biotin carboxyl carrier protein [Rhodymenia pseudopalmata]AOM64286.1 acetyl-CoA carboxylase biotin carboxyl carrier protein [Rhodymenia pseudopalmata]
MKFQIKELKNILNSTQDNKINIVKIKSKHFELIIHKTIQKAKNNSLIKKRNIGSKITSDKIEAKTVKLTENNKTKITHEELETYSTIVSPMVGTFYRSPAPNERAFIEQYDIFHKKQTVCIIEAMKLMNEIEAEVDGEIVEIMVKDGDVVDCGQALMKVKAK